MEPNEKLTDKIEQKILQGNIAETAAIACGVSASIYHKWMRTAEEQIAGNIEGTLYTIFYDAIKSAEARLQVAAVGEFFDAGKSDWRARQAFLERRFPEQWGKKDSKTIRVTGNLQPAATPVIKQLENAEFVSGFSKLLKAIAYGEEIIEGDFEYVDESESEPDPDSTPQQPALTGTVEAGGIC